MDQIGKRIKAFRKARGMNQTQLANKIDVNPSLISKLESNQTQGSLQTLKKISSALGISINDLLDEENDKSTIRPTGTC